MAKALKSADQLRALLIAEAISDPVCPRSFDVVIRRDLADGWTAQIVAPTCRLMPIVRDRSERLSSDFAANIALMTQVGLS